MFKVKLMNKIAKVGTDVLSKEKYEISDNLENEDAILVRSAALHELAFGENLKAIARCGAGVNNIPIEKCTKSGVVVFNTPGANANAVKELAIAALIGLVISIAIPVGIIILIVVLVKKSKAKKAAAATEETTETQTESAE